MDESKIAQAAKALDHLTMDAMWDELQALRAALSRSAERIAELESQLCAAREALNLVRHAHELGGSVIARSVSGPITLGTQYMNAKADAIEAVLGILADSSPCPHAAIAEAKDAEIARLTYAADFIEEQLGEGPADDASTKWILEEFTRRRASGKE